MKKSLNGGADKEWLSIEQLTKWTNTKAIMNGAGDQMYRDLKPFTCEEIRRHLGIYILQGIVPSPRVELKFASQSYDPIYGNDFAHNSFGTNAVRRHRHFKAFFAVQNPMIETPDRRNFPNWKVRPLINWINCVGPLVYKPGMSISVDEMTMRFKGKHKDKLRITYKKEGDGFQADALCDDGFTLQVHMSNDPAPKKYLKHGLSPLHARVMSLFDVLEENYHQCAMDNLYNSAAHCRAAFNHKRKVLCHGVARKGNRGIPACVAQKEMVSRKDQLKVRGTVKAAVLDGDEGCPNLIASSVHDTKPVHYLSMISEEVKWIEKERSLQCRYR